MTLRDAIVIAITALSVPVALFNAYFGILMWTWIAYFAPHRYAWGFVRMSMPIAYIIAIPTLVGTLFAPKNLRIFTRESVLLALMWIWFGVTTLYTYLVPEFLTHSKEATAELGEVSKILLMTFVTIMLVTSKGKLRILVLVILASFGIRAFFAALFYVATDGQFLILGPEGTFLADNNDFALALNMTVPMFFYAARMMPKTWMRVGLRVLMVGVIISVVGTYSRGGLVGLTAVALAIVAKSRQKVISLILVSILVFSVVSFTTLKWQDRMLNFMQGNLDSSEIARLVAWTGGWNLALHYPLTGGGFNVFTDEAIFPQFVPAQIRGALYGKLGTLHSSHSIYFEVLGEQGFVGLGMFLGLLGTCFVSLRKLRKRARVEKNLEWVVPYTNMFDVALIAYMTNGATLGRAYFDFFYQIVACIVILKILALRDVQASVSGNQPVETLEAVAA